MNTECTAQQMEFHGLGRRRVVCEFNGGRISSDSGGLLLREVEQRTHILKRLGECFVDYRDPDQIDQSPDGAVGVDERHQSVGHRVGDLRGAAGACE